IHIDGHSDMAPPKYFPGFPFFKFPSKGKDRFLMQENDMFIMSAVITGLIGKVVWIWPSWDEVNHQNFSFGNKMEIGLTTNSFDIQMKTFCLCTTNETCQTMCFGVLNEFIDDEFVDFVEIYPKSCEIKRTITFEEIREEEGVEKMAASLTYIGTQGTILDIDEDYYGCMHAIRPLLDAGLTEERVSDIDEILSELFCPKDAAEEFFTDQLLVGFLDEILKLRCTKGKTDATGHDCLNEMFILSFTKQVKKKLFQHYSNLLCFGVTKIHTKNMLMRHLIEKFLGLNNAQNKALQYVGFCLTSTPLTFNLSNEGGFLICHGRNTPNESIVIEHQTNIKEITQRTNSLRNILAVIKKANPKVVTLCRSMRDGYTPRKYFSKIENDVIDSLRHTFENTKVVYDSGLLGGKKGWPERNKR
ncbi:hypothetical protein FSP39_022432, partial [Pinctada imbricata]